MMHNNINITPNQYAFPQFLSAYGYKCFPVRNTKKFATDDGSAWLIEYKAEKIRQLKVLAKNHSKSRRHFKEEKKEPKKLTADFLTKQYSAKQPSDICSINISGKNLHTSQIKNEDFSFFENTIKIDASDNQLTFESFKSFPQLGELELQLNSISCIHASHKTFPCLLKLDLSFNPLKDKALLNLGKLRQLKTLILQGCGLIQLPPGLARGYLISEIDSKENKEKCEQKQRYPELTHLNLSNNKLIDISTFASLAGLKKLQSLNLSSNKISGVPHLRLLAAHRHFSISTVESSVDDGMPSKSFNISLDRENNKLLKEKGNNDYVLETTPTVTPTNSKVQSNPYKNEVSTQNNDQVTSQNKTTGNEENTKKCEVDDDLLNFDFNTQLVDKLTNDNLGLTTGNGEVDDLYEELITEELKRPFASLEELDLSHNVIALEDSLLALTSWPMLQYLNVAGNPLMKAHRGIPAVLKHHLQKMCGIKIYKYEPKLDPVVRPPPIKTHRVKTDLPPIKRNNLLMIEAAIANAVENRKVEETTKSAHLSNGSRHSSVGPSQRKQNGEGGGTVNDIHDPSSSEETFSGEQIFLTQVEEDEVEHSNEIPKTEKRKKKLKDVDKRFKGFELLLETDDDSVLNDHETELPVPSTIQGSLKELKHLIEHPLVFKTSDPNDKRLEFHEPRKSPTRRKDKKKGKTVSSTIDMDDVSNALHCIRHQETFYQGNLADVLETYNDDPEMRKRFPKAKKMLRRVQDKYEHVRTTSLRPITIAQSEMRTISTRSEQPSQELVLSRMKKKRVGDMPSSSRGSTPGRRAKCLRNKPDVYQELRSSSADTKYRSLSSSVS